MSDDSGEQPAAPGTAGAIRAVLRTFALGLPGAYEEFPWGKCVVKVNRLVLIIDYGPSSSQALNAARSQPGTAPSEVGESVFSGIAAFDGAPATGDG